MTSGEYCYLARAGAFFSEAFSGFFSGLAAVFPAGAPGMSLTSLFGMGAASFGRFIMRFSLGVRQQEAADHVQHGALSIFSPCGVREQQDCLLPILRPEWCGRFQPPGLLFFVNRRNRLAEQCLERSLH
jgi:hypothetical protein